MQAVDDVRSGDRRRRGGRAGRRVRLRQVDARPHRRRHRSAERGPRALPRRGARRARRRGPAQRQAQAADDLPGPDGVAQSAHAGDRPRRRGAGGARHRLGGRAAGLRRRDARCASASIRATAAAIRTSSPAASARASASRARSRCGPSSWSATSRWRRSTSRSRRRCSTCSCELRRELGLTYLFISHDLGVVEHLSDRVVIMYLGRVVEIAATEELFARPNHPYTQALLANAPRLEARKQRFTPVNGEIPSPFHPPSGCHFHPRCPFAMARCRSERPALARDRAGPFLGLPSQRGQLRDGSRHRDAPKQALDGSPRAAQL